MADPKPHNPLDDEQQEGWRDVLVAWGPAFLAVIIIRLFIFEPFRIPSGSMVPTLLIGDHVLVTKFSYGVWMPFKSLGVPFTNIGLDDVGLDLENVELLDLGDPQRGDIIVFHYPQDEDVTYIKRVVGVPGDTIRVVDNQIILNGERQARVPLGNFDDIGDRCDVRVARRWRETLERIDGTTLDHAILTNVGRPGILSDRREVTVPPDAVFVMGDNRDHSQDGRAWGFVRYNQIKGKAHAIWLSWNGCSGTPGSLRLDRMPKSLYDDSDVQGGEEPAAEPSSIDGEPGTE